MAILRWDPFSELNNLHDQVNSLFNSTFGNVQDNSVLAPVSDVYDNGKALVIETHLPDFKEDEINIEQHQGELEIKAEHKEKEENKDRKYLVRESVSRYYRRFSLPKNSDPENIKAHFVNGILKLTIPYKELPQPKRIAISTKGKTAGK